MPANRPASSCRRTAVTRADLSLPLCMPRTAGTLPARLVWIPDRADGRRRESGASHLPTQAGRTRQPGTAELQAAVSPGAARRCALPAHVVPLHDAVALGQLDAAGQRAGERAERLAVVADESFRSSLRARSASAVNRSAAARLGERDAVEVAGEPDGRRPRGRRRRPRRCARSRRGASCTPVTRFHATARPSVAVPTPADQRQAVSRAWYPAEASIRPGVRRSRSVRPVDRHARRSRAPGPCASR